MNRTIGVKYCGGCNPEIDRTGLAAEIGSRLPPGCRLEAVRPSDSRGIAVLICGCPTACADRPEVRGLARRWVRVGGATLDCEPVPPEQLADRVTRNIEKLLEEAEQPSATETPP
jgi:hypothetical protein